MRTSFCFDVEDFQAPENLRLDDLVMDLCKTMTDAGIQGTLFTIGEKARVLRERGRQDVIDAMSKHDIGSHTNMGSIHPTVTERMEHAVWSDGVARMLADEATGIQEISEIIGTPVRTLARHGGSYSPHLVNALGKINVAYCYSPVQLPNHNINWFCNCLNFHSCIATFQNSYFTIEDFNKAEEFFFNVYEEMKDFDWTGIFHSHPCAIKMKGFGCKNYYNGIFTPLEECEIPDVRENYDEEALLKNFAMHCEKLKSDSRFTITTMGDMAEEFKNQAEDASAEEIMHLAQMAAD
ncbi:MAG: hypothetical protein ACYTFY_08285, partial [Planctomycetota bacterium]